MARPRFASLIAIFVIAGSLSGGAAAQAATVDVVVDAAEMELESGDGGTQVGKVTLSNLSDRPAQLALSIPGDAGCSITPVPTSIKAGRRTQVSLTFGAGCDVERGADVRLAFGQGLTPASQVLTATAPSAGANWDILLYAFLIAGGLAVAVAFVLWALMVNHNLGTPIQMKRKRKTKAAGRQRQTKKANEKERVKLKFRTPLQSLGTDWSFKDNWVGNVTIGSAALVALLAASDVLEAVLGEEPEAALGLLAVASALAAVFVAIGPLLVKVIGDDIAVPTIGGMLAAAFVTLLGTMGQISAVTWQGAELASGNVKRGVIALGFAIGAVVLFYATKALWAYAKSGAEPPSSKPSDVARAASVVARAIRDLGHPPQPDADDDKRARPRKPSRTPARMDHAHEETEIETTMLDEEILDLTALRLAAPSVLEKRNALL
jgi:hypothetical protein